MPSRRLSPSLRTVVAGTLLVVPGGLVALGSLVTFSNGEVADASQMNANFELLHDATRSASAVGDVVASMLTPEQLAAARGPGWVLADGRSVAGSEYEALTGRSTVPDLRGVFLRGKNNARSDGKQNPDGEVALGAYQADMFASHNHKVNSTKPAGPVYTSNEFGGVDSSQNHRYDVTTMIGNAGGNETRARNVTVNYFIRID